MCFSSLSDEHRMCKFTCSCFTLSTLFLQLCQKDVYILSDPWKYVQTGSSLPSATSATSAAVQHCRYAGRGGDCSAEIIGKIAKCAEVGVCSNADSSTFYQKMWEVKWSLDFGLLRHLCIPPHIDTQCIWSTKVLCVKEHKTSFSCLRLQAGKTIWANMFSMCRIHITSNCCRPWLGNRETWRSSQLLQNSLRHFDFSQQQESLALFIPLWLCWSSPCIFLACNEQTVIQLLQWVCHDDCHDTEVANVWKLACFCWHVTDQVCDEFWTTEFSPSSARFGVRMCLPLFTYVWT